MPSNLFFKLLDTTNSISSHMHISNLYHMGTFFIFLYVYMDYGVLAVFVVELL